MLIFPMTFTDPYLQGHGIFEVEYLKYGQSFYKTLIGNYTVYRMVPLSMTLSDL